MDPFEDFEEILVQSRLNFADSKPKSRLERQNRPRTASLRAIPSTTPTTRVQQATPAVQSATSTPTTIIRRQISDQQGKNADKYSSVNRGKQSRVSPEEDSNINSRSDELAGRVGSEVIENTSLSAYSGKVNASKQLEQQLETVSEVSEELSVEWHEQSAEKSSPEIKLANDSSETGPEIDLGDKTDEESEVQIEDKLKSRFSTQKETPTKQTTSDEDEDGEPKDVEQLEDIVNLVSELESSEESSKLDGNRAEDLFESPKSIENVSDNKDTNLDDIWQDESRDRSNSEISVIDSPEPVKTRGKQNQYSLKLIESKLERKLDSFGDDLIRLFQDQFNFLMNSISQHIERIESSRTQFHLSTPDQPRGETTETRPFELTSGELEQNKDRNGVQYKVPAKSNRMSSEERSQIAIEDHSESTEKKCSTGSLVNREHVETASKGVQVGEVKERDTEFGPLIQLYERRLRQYDGIILINSISSNVSELSCSDLRKNDLHSETTTRSSWRGRTQYELEDTCCRRSKFTSNANSLLSETRLATRQLEHRRILLLNSTKQIQELPQKKFPHLAQA